MPSRKVGEADYRDIAHPINSSMRTEIQKVIFEAYERAKTEQDDNVEETFLASTTV